jgi:30S ribosomal protein S31
LEARSFDDLIFCIYKYHFKFNAMGKGDKKSKRGKIVLGTYGARRHRKDAKKLIPAASAHAEVKIKEEPEVTSAAPKRKSKTLTSH